MGLAVLAAALLLVLPQPASLAGEGDVPEPESYRLDRYREPVPKTLKGARVIGADEKPVADARVHWLQEPGQVPDLVARTGADGVAVLVLAASVDRLGRPAATETRVFQVVAEGYAAEQCG